METNWKRFSLLLHLHFPNKAGPSAHHTFLS